MHQWIKQLKEKVIQWAIVAKDWFSSMWSKLSSLLTYSPKSPAAAIATGSEQATTPVASSKIMTPYTDSQIVTQEAACVPAAFLPEWINNIFAQNQQNQPTTNTNTSDL